jgi:16S rRNA G966 N2-methylase RsmD
MVQLSLDSLTEQILEQKQHVVQSGILHLESCWHLGQLLIEARGRFPEHGNRWRENGWYDYLKDSVRIERSKAERFMALADLERSNLSALPSDLTVSAAIDLLRDQRKLVEATAKAERKASIPADLADDPERYQLISGNFTDVAIPAGSADIIITDPPYPQEYLPLYGDLAAFAERTLKPGGVALVMVGQSWLPEVLALMTPRLRYHWTLAYEAFGSHTKIWHRNVLSGWKPVLWFTNGDWDGDGVYDVISSEARDKDFHAWGQSESGMATLVERFTYPGDVVIDPFLGGGTTGIVCLKLNRRFIGIDIDAEAIATSRRRYAEVLAA